MWRMALTRVWVAACVAGGVGSVAVGCDTADERGGTQHIGDVEVVATLPGTWAIGVASEVTVTMTRGGVGVTGLAPTATFIHVAHGHGGTTVPAVEAMGDGVYRVSSLTPSMAGTWRLTVGVNGGTAHWDAVVR